MDHNITQNATCEFDGYLICKMPARHGRDGTQKLKPEEGSTFSTRTPTLEQRGIIHGTEQTKESKIHTRRGKIEVDSEVATSSETEIQRGKGFAYPPELFTNPKFAQTVPC